MWKRLKSKKMKPGKLIDYMALKVKELDNMKKKEDDYYQDPYKLYFSHPNIWSNIPNNTNQMAQQQAQALNISQQQNQQLQFSAQQNMYIQSHSSGYYTWTTSPGYNVTLPSLNSEGENNND